MNETSRQSHKNKTRGRKAMSKHFWKERFITGQKKKNGVDKKKRHGIWEDMGRGEIKEKNRDWQEDSWSFVILRA